MTTKRESIKNSNGFTLVELMITLFLTAIAVVGIYRGYTSFSQTADAQEQIIEMQQNLRIGMYHLEKDIRRAGMKEEDGETVGFDVEDEAQFTSQIALAADLTGGETDGIDNDNDDAIDGDDTDPFPFDESTYGDGDTEDDGEIIIYYLVYDNEATNTIDPCPAIFDPDIYPCYLMREDTNAVDRHKIIGNVDALNFVYLDEDRRVIPMTAAGIDPGEQGDIRIVQVCLVVRTTNEDYRYTNNESYENITPLADGGPDEILPPQGDNFRRRVFCKEIKVRNAGI
jgi:prepilin-type N-terminal cleavage/methylation domain-containing protein